MIKLTITEKGGEPRALTFDQNEVSIGRVQGNDIVLPKGNISKRHSRLTMVDGKIVVADVKSTNGTYVNGRKIGEATPVRSGDKIFVGDFLIVIDPHGAPTVEGSVTGARRTPPPPPPPPPRPGSAVRPTVNVAAEADGTDESASRRAGRSGGDMDSRGDTSDVGGPGSMASDLVGLGGTSGVGSESGRLRPPAPPPPPPRRTIPNTTLQDDSVDIGIGGDEPPPSPDDVSGAGMGDVRSGDVDAADVDRISTGGPNSEAGHDVFGSRPAHDEDDSASSSAESPTHGNRRGDGVDGRASVPPPAPVSASHAAMLASFPADSGDVGETHGQQATALESLLADSTVTTIVITPDGGMRIDRGGTIETVPGAGDGNAVAETIWQIANTAQPPPPSDNPVVDVRLLDGTRVTALFPPITAGSVSAVFRRGTPAQVPLADIAGSSDVETIVRAALSSRRNLLLVGDPPAVATLLLALGEALPVERRVVAVGTGSGRATGTSARASWIELGVGSDPAGLARAAVAFQADHLLFTDAGGAELPELLLAAARGQDGLIACMAARSADEALTRLRVFTAGALGAAGLSALVTSTIDLIIVAGTSPSGDVRISEIAEPQMKGGAEGAGGGAAGENADGGRLDAVSVARRPEKHRGATTLDVTGVSTRLAVAIAAVADELPGHLVRR